MLVHTPQGCLKLLFCDEIYQIVVFSFKCPVCFAF